MVQGLSGARDLSSTRITACRSCGHGGLSPVLSLGSTPLANRLPPAGEAPESEPRFPLELVFCPACSLLQITETVNPEILFKDYVYFTSYSETMVAHAAVLAAAMIAKKGLGGQSLVVEAASNDGYLLQHYKGAGIPVLGIEPAANVARQAMEKRGVPTEVEYFCAEAADRLVARGIRADVFHAHNVLAHVGDLGGFVRGMKRILKDDGVAVIEVPYARSMVDQRQFDTIYHEHLCYFSLTALNSLLRRHGLVPRDASIVPIHGGSLRVVAGHGDPAEPGGDAVRAMLAGENAVGLDQLDYYARFAKEVRGLGEVLAGLLANLKSGGCSIAAYGASAKGSTLLNYFGIGKETLDFVADRSEVKQGKLTPGTRIPIVHPEKLASSRPDYCLLLTWNLAGEILAQQATYRASGGRFIVPIPDVQVV